MDFGLRDWLLILGPLFIVAVLLHGYWKMRTGRNKIKMSLDKSFMSSHEEGEDVDDLNLLKAELPSGGARVIKPEQQNLELDEDVPVLMEPVEVEDDEGEDEPVQPPAMAADSGEDESDEEEIDADEQVQEDKGSNGAGGERPEKILVIHVLAQDGKFRGQGLLEALVDLDMTWADMEIFHRFDERGQPMFSLANAVEPGTFDMSTMDRMETPGVILFMKAHELADPETVYNDMLEVATRLSEELGGEMRDETRSVLTPQTIEHCRQDIRDYQLKYA